MRGNKNCSQLGRADGEGLPGRGDMDLSPVERGTLGRGRGVEYYTGIFRGESLCSAVRGPTRRKVGMRQREARRTREHGLHFGGMGALESRAWEGSGAPLRDEQAVPVGRVSP